MTKTVLLNGHVACLKTTLGYALAPALGLAHLSNSVLGSFVADDQDPLFGALRANRYQKAFSLAEQYFKLNVPLLLDGTYSKREWRQEIYRLAAENNVRDIVLVTCTCSDPSRVAERLAFRERNSNAPDAAANSWAAYAGSVAAFEDVSTDVPCSDQVISRLRFDSGSFTLRRELVSSEFSEQVAKEIEAIISSGRLATPAFSTSQKSPPTVRRRNLLALEGISGSGKSTQARQLASILSNRRTPFTLMDEFSDTQMGDFIRASAGLNGDQRVRIGESSGHADCLLILGDGLRRAHRLTSGFQSGNGLLVADGFRLSHIAHSLAYLPESTATGYREWMRIAVEAILHPLKDLANRHRTIYIDLAPEVALKRLAQRLNCQVSPEAELFVHRLSTEYRLLLEKEESVLRIDGDQPVREVAAHIQFAIGDSID